MIDHKRIIKIFNVFMKFYKGELTIGLKDLYEEYGEDKLFQVLISNLDEGLKVPIPEVMKDIYQIYKDYRECDLEDQDWQDIIDQTGKVHEKWKKNNWCKNLVLEILNILEDDDKERRKIQKEIAEEMEASIKAETNKKSAA